MVVCFDFDSTIITKETLDEAIVRTRRFHADSEVMISEIAEITMLAMEGAIDFTESVRRRIAGVSLTKQLLEETGVAMLEHITPGMEHVFTWLAEKGEPVCVVSGGFRECVLPVSEKLGIPHERTYTNRFLYDEIGNVIDIDESSLLWTNEGKGPALRAERTEHPGEMFVLIGDGMNDYRAFESGAADVFCGFGANVRRETVAMRAEHFVTSSADLLTFLQKTL